MEHMNLKEWIQQRVEKGQEGVFLADSVRNANVLLRRNGDSRGISTGSLEDLAYPYVIRALAEKGEFDAPQRVGVEEAAVILEGIIRDPKSEIHFIPESSICRMALKDILFAINQIRKGRPISGSGDAKSMGGRVGELLHLKELYEKELENTQCYDAGRILKCALEYLTEHPERGDLHIAMISGMEVSDLERCFAEAVTTKGSLCEVQAAPEEAEKEQFSEIVFFRGWGILNEIRNIVGQIKERAIPYGDVAVMYSHPDYVPHLISVMEAEGIPVAAVSPVSAERLTKIYLLEKLLEWAKSDFSYEMLRPFCLHPSVSYLPMLSREERKEEKEARKKGERSKYYAMNYCYLREITARIGWGRERYLAYADQEAEIEGKSEEEAIKVRESHEGKRWFRELLRELAECFACDEKEQISTLELLRRLWEQLGKCTYGMMIREEAPFAKSVYHNILRGITDEKMSLEQAIHILQERLQESRYKGGESASAVSLLCLQDAVITDRGNVFVVGLSNKYCRQSTTESPSLTDAELCALVDETAGGLRLARDAGERFAKKMKRSIATLQKGCNLWVGCAVYDSLELKMDSPSMLWYELRDQLIGKDAETELLDYQPILAGDLKIGGLEELKLQEFSHEQEPDADETDDWEEEDDDGYAYDWEEEDDDEYADDEYDDDDEYEAYEDIEDESASEESSDSDTELVTKTGEESDDVLDKMREFARQPDFSPTAFQTLMECPRKFYYAYILKLNSEEYMEVTTDEWLNAADRGTLFHRIAELYTNKKFMDPTQKVDKKPDEDVLEKCLQQAVKEMEDTLPVAAEPVQKEEVEVLRKVSKKYFEKLHEEFSDVNCKWKVDGCELRIEVLAHNKIVLPGWYEDADPKEVEVKLRGRIDRLDVYEDEKGMKHYRIVDYKTGKKDTTEEKCKDYREMQHILYAMALRQEQAAEVDEMCYVFPMTLENGSDLESLPMPVKDISDWPEHVLRLYRASVVNGYYHAQEKYHYDNGDTWYNKIPKIEANKRKKNPGKKAQEDACKYCMYGKNGICLEKREEKKY